MRFYVNSKYELVCAPDYSDKFGDKTSYSLMINTCSFTRQIEEEIILAVEEVLKRHEDKIPKELVKELLEEQKRQVRASYDTSATLTEAFENENNKSNRNYE